MTIKMIAIDIDGTLNNDNHHITPAVKKAIQTAVQQGIKIVLCTGRPMPGVWPYLQDLNLQGRDDQYVISFNGGLAQTTNGQIEAHYTIDFDDYLDWELFARQANVHAHMETAEDIYTANQDISRYSIVETYLANMRLHYRSMDQINAMRNHITICKLMMLGDKEELDRVYQQIPARIQEKFHILRSEDFYIEYINKAASKGNALRNLGQRLGIQQNEIMALGNGGNDLSMIKYAGLGVAMGNSIPQVLDLADVVTADNNHDGVAAAINKSVLK